ncbi:hypothetical protein ACFT5B_10830 [Luteimicrobium sp. NPDC057192]|uniref:hypothetical protein n=1 Tax=Luteimicrobium sp. NPDC057192 TaxID=3346042 RepID=UPI0036290047
MTMPSRTPFRLGLPAVGVIAGVAALSGCAPGDRGEPRTEVVHASWAFDIRDPEVVAGRMDDIFIGKVVSAGDVESDDPMPKATFTVEVASSIKGDEKGTIDVVQEGGFDESENAVYTFEGDRLLEVGKTYFFASRGAKHQLLPITGDRLLDEEGEASKVTATYEAAVG